MAFKRYGVEGVVDFEARSRASGLTCLTPSKTVQAQAEDADINVIVKRFGITGKLPVLPNLPEYGDFTDAPRDYREALERLEAAEKAFYTVPSEVRAKFGHDPATFFDAVHNASKEQLKEWGLSPPEEAPAVIKVTPEGTTPDVV